MTFRQQISALLGAARGWLARKLVAGPADERPHVILHIGPHRTGSTTIQATLRASGGAVPHDVNLVTRKTPAYTSLSRLTYGIRTPEAALAAADEIRAETRVFAQHIAGKWVSIISDEDLLGPLPTRRRIKGLYPNMEAILPHVLAGFADEGVRVTVAWQHRDYADWLESVYHRRWDLAPEIPFDLQKFSRRHNFPADWRDFEERLAFACADVKIARLSFEEDAASGIMGRGLFRLAGLSDVAIDNMKHSRPRHSAPMRSTLARFEGDSRSKPEK